MSSTPTAQEVYSLSKRRESIVVIKLVNPRRELKKYENDPSGRWYLVGKPVVVGVVVLSEFHQTMKELRKYSSGETPVLEERCFSTPEEAVKEVLPFKAAVYWSRVDEYENRIKEAKLKHDQELQRLEKAFRDTERSMAEGRDRQLAEAVRVSGLEWADFLPLDVVARSGKCST